MARQLSDILLGSNKDSGRGWAQVAARSFDVLLSDYGKGSWSVGCNLERIDRGTIGWIVRSDGGWGHLAGVLAVDGPPAPEREPGGTVHYAPGLLFPFPREWWIDGARLNLAGWPSAAPFGSKRTGGRMAQFRSGQELHRDGLRLIESRLHPLLLDWVEQRRGSLA